MAQVIQLELKFANFPAIEKQEKRIDIPKGRKLIWEDDTFHLRIFEPTKQAGKNPCAKCYLREVCDNDSCGRKIFPIDVNEIY